MNNELLNQGVMLMLVGMGTVFVFLTTLVIATTLMSKIVMRMTSAIADGGVSEVKVAAIAAAIRQHRQR